MDSPPVIHPDLLRYLSYCRDRISADDIRRNIINDPGAENYFQRWNTIRLGGDIPPTEDIYLSEGMEGLAISGSVHHKSALVGILKFRRLTHAVALVMHSWNWKSAEDVIPINYVCLNCVRDLEPDSDEYLYLIRNVLAAVRTSQPNSPEYTGYPFILLAEIILAQKGKDYHSANVLAGLLISAESELREWGSMIHDDHFLLGLTYFDHLHKKWLQQIRKLDNPYAHPDLARLISELEPLT